MNISIFGLGYVGAVSAGCLAARGHRITGVDVHHQKVESFNQGTSPIIEPGLKDLLSTAVEKGLLRATVSCDEAVATTDVSVICVGTPSQANGALDLGFVRGVTEQIASALRRNAKPFTLVVRSTMLPGSTAHLAQEYLSDLVSVGSLQLYHYPEFMREGTAVADFEKPSLAVVGTRDGARPPLEFMHGLFGEKAAVVNWRTAEMLKYACNAFHALKIAFANEIGRVGKQLEIDARAVMNLLCQDTQLNLSSCYLNPGNHFGGSCLRKDIRALTKHAREQGLHLPVLENLLPSNERHFQSLLNLITCSGQEEVAILGLSFKADTDDLRDSPMVEVAQTLLGRGCKLRIYDPALNLAALLGTNKRVIDMKMPHLASLLCSDLSTAVGQRGLVVAAQKCAPLAELKRVITPSHLVLDVNGWPELKELPSRYVGFCW